jgi:hypothetical protein
LPRVFAARVLALTLGSAFSFFTLMSLRGLVAICAGERMAERLATVLQIATIVGLVETFLFLPSVLSTLVEELLRGGTEFAWLPPVLFGALYAVAAEGIVRSSSRWRSSACLRRWRQWRSPLL